MKKAVMNITTIICAVFIVFSGFTKLNSVPMPWNSPKYMQIDFSAYFFPLLFSSGIFMLFGIFSIIKLFVKNKGVIKIGTSLLAIISLASIIYSIIHFSSLGTYYIKLLIQSDSKLIIFHIFQLSLSLVLIIACINSFKPFINKRTNMVLSLCICAIGLIGGIFFTNYPNEASLRFIINKLYYLCFSPTLYCVLKTTPD